jgi:hypothetical protein
VFNSFVRSLSRALRTLAEVTTLNMLLRSDARRARDDLLDIALSLPFQGEVNTGFGVLAKVYLDALTHLNNQQRVRDPNAEGVREAKAMALEICEETFPGVRSPRMEVERGFRFWDVVSDRMVMRGVACSDADGEFFRRLQPCGNYTRSKLCCQSLLTSLRRRRRGLDRCGREGRLAWGLQRGKGRKDAESLAGSSGDHVSIIKN